MRRLIPIVAVLCAITMAQTGCQSPIMASNTRPPKILVAKNGQVTVDGQPVQVSQLGKKLKSMGVSTKSPILVSVYKDMPKAVESNIGRPLISAGYTKLLFVEPKQVSATTSTTTPKVSYSTSRASTSTVTSAKQPVTTKASSSTTRKTTSTKKSSSSTQR